MLRCRQSGTRLTLRSPWADGRGRGVGAELRQARVLVDLLLARVRWWYEQGVADQEGYLASRACSRSVSAAAAEAVLLLMESAARDWADFEADAVRRQLSSP